MGKEREKSPKRPKDLKHRFHAERDMRICPNCGKENPIPVEDIIMDIEQHTFIVMGERCLKCGEEFIAEKEGQKMIVAAKRLGIWGNN
jgi:ribosomal protein S27AE